MNNPFGQPKLIYKVYFNTFYKYIESFEEFFPEDVLGFSSFEVESTTVESAPNDKWRFEVYYGQAPQEELLIANLKNFAKSKKIEIIDDIHFIKLEDKDWVTEYQAQLVPLNIGKFFISIAKQSAHCPINSIPIILEASRAFGTGDHATTAGCLEAIEILSVNDFKTIYDIGSGSGILSFAVAKTWPKATILACDIEESAVEVAQINQTFNNTNIHFYQNSPDNLILPAGFPTMFDLIISNILAKPLIQLAADIKSLLNSNGKVVLSGFLDYQMDDVVSAYNQLGFFVEKIINKEQWITLILIKSKID